MSTQISTNYRELAPDEVIQVAAECQKAWMDPAIPRRQFDLATKGELESFRNGGKVAPYDALVRCMRQIPLKHTGSRSKLLDVGASSGYARAVLRTAGYFMQYTACDFSEAFKKLAKELYPDIAFDVEDARSLSYHDDSFETVLNGACIMHNREYAQVISESVRVASKYIIFHRTPVLTDRPTTFFVKEAYGIPCLEAHFNETELLRIFSENGLKLLYVTDVFWNGTSGHRSYLLSKSDGISHHSV